jgi:hypothetical protein
MKQQAVYELIVEDLSAYRQISRKEPFVVFFSNLSKAVQTLEAHLAINNWDTEQINYSAVYRQIKAREKFSADFWFGGIKFFRITIRRRILNPNITTLGIDQKPTIKPTL